MTTSLSDSFENSNSPNSSMWIFSPYQIIRCQGHDPFCFYQILLKWKITVIFLALDLRDILFSFTTIYRISSNIRLSFSHNDNHPINIPISSFFRVDRKKKSYSIQYIICNSFWDHAEYDVMITIKKCRSLHNAASFETNKLIDILWILKQ